MLKGKWCLVTGGGRGIGRTIALALAKESASLALTARSVGQLESVAAECKAVGAPEVEVYPADLTDTKAVDGLAATLLAKHGCVSVLVNNAGVLPNGMSALQGDPDEWEKVRGDEMFLFHLSVSGVSVVIARFHMSRPALAVSSFMLAYVVPSLWTAGKPVLSAGFTRFCSSCFVFCWAEQAILVSVGVRLSRRVWAYSTEGLEIT